MARPVIGVNLEIDSPNAPRLKHVKNVPEQRPANAAPAMARMNSEVLHKILLPALREANKIAVRIKGRKAKRRIVFAVA